MGGSRITVTNVDNRSEPSLLGGDVRLGGFPRNNHYHTNRDDADGQVSASHDRADAYDDDDDGAVGADREWRLSRPAA